MATEFARMRQIYGTTADFAANDLVLLAGELALELTVDGNVWAKVGDGVLTFSNLPYTAGNSVDLTTDQDVGGVKTFTDSILIQNQNDQTKAGQLFSGNFPGLVHMVELDSREISSNLYLVSRDAAGLAQVLVLGADGRLYWKGTEIANSNGLAGVNWGGFNNLGVIERGVGYSVAHPATGQYDLQFDLAAFDNVSQSVVASCNAQLQSPLTCQVQMADAYTCTIWVYDTVLDAPANSSISFIRNFVPSDNTAPTF